MSNDKDECEKNCEDIITFYTNSYEIIFRPGEVEYNGDVYKNPRAKDIYEFMLDMLGHHKHIGEHKVVIGEREYEKLLSQNKIMRDALELYSNLDRMKCVAQKEEDKEVAELNTKIIAAIWERFSEPAREALEKVDKELM